MPKIKTVTKGVKEPENKEWVKQPDTGEWVKISSVMKLLAEIHKSQFGDRIENEDDQFQDLRSRLHVLEDKVMRLQRDNSYEPLSDKEICRTIADVWRDARPVLRERIIQDLAADRPVYNPNDIIWRSINRD